MKHYFRNQISVASKLLLSTASIGDISATSVFVGGEAHPIYHEMSHLMKEHESTWAFVFKLISGIVSCSIEALSVIYLGALVTPCQEQQ